MNCKDYVERIIQDIQGTTAANRTRFHYEKRDLLYYSWLLQNRAFSVERSALETLTGIGYNEQEIYMADMPSACRGKSSSTHFTFSDAMMSAIANVLNSSEQNYYISKPVPFFANTNGISFLELLNHITDNLRGMNFVAQVSNAFNEAIPNLSIHTIRNDLDYVRLVTDPASNWCFVLITFPMFSMLNGDAVRNLYGTLFAIQEEITIKACQQQPDILLIGPAATEDGRLELQRRKNVHHLWPFSALRFFHLLKDVVAKYNSTVVSSSFPAIFNVQSVKGVYSARQAITALENKAEKKTRNTINP